MIHIVPDIFRVVDMFLSVFGALTLPIVLYERRNVIHATESEIATWCIFIAVELELVSRIPRELNDWNTPLEWYGTPLGIVVGLLVVIYIILAYLDLLKRSQRKGI